MKRIRSKPPASRAGKRTKALGPKTMPPLPPAPPKKALREMRIELEYVTKGVVNISTLVDADRNKAVGFELSCRQGMFEQFWLDTEDMLISDIPMPDNLYLSLEIEGTEKLGEFLREMFRSNNFITTRATNDAGGKQIVCINFGWPSQDGRYAIMMIGDAGTGILKPYGIYASASALSAAYNRKVAELGGTP